MLSTPRRCSTRVSRRLLTRIGEIGMSKTLHHLWHDEEGQDLAEYALLVVLIVLVAITSMRVIGHVVSHVFSNSAGNLTPS